MEKTMEKIMASAKNRGSVYPGPEIYGGLADTQDYGNLGVELKNNIKRTWWQKFIMENPYNVGAGYAILMNSQTWTVNRYLGRFSDPLMDYKQYKERFHVDKLVEDYNDVHRVQMEGPVGSWPQEQMKQYINNSNICCPSYGAYDFTDAHQLNLMLKTLQGVIEDAKSVIYLRPETTQGTFVNFKNVQRASRKKVPFDIGQIGKSFRNEITPGNPTFRIRELEQVELEFFCKPDTDLEWLAYWKEFCISQLRSLGIKDNELGVGDHSPEELSFYSKTTTDLEYLLPFSWGEFWGIADRTGHDLGQYRKVSGQDMSYFDDGTKKRYIPYVTGPSLGVDHVTLASPCTVYDEEEIGEGDVRTVPHFHPAITSVRVGVLPLSKKLNEGAEKIYTELSRYFSCEFDDRGNIGRRYRRQDEIGTPFCTTYDFDSEEGHATTVRDRDIMEQVRVPIAELKDYLAEKFMF